MEIAHQFLLGFGAGRHAYSPHEEQWPSVEGGASMQMRTASQLPVKIEAVLVERAAAQAFALEDIRIGQNCMTAGTYDVPLAPFAIERAALAELLDVRGMPMVEQPPEGDKATPRDVVQPLFALGTALPGQDITLSVRNVSGSPCRFLGALVVRPAEMYRKSLHGETRWVTEPPEVCGCCDMVLEELAPGVNWCALCGSATVDGRLRPSAFGLVAPEERLLRVRKQIKESRGF